MHTKDHVEEIVREERGHPKNPTTVCDLSLEALSCDGLNTDSLPLRKWKKIAREFTSEDSSMQSSVLTKRTRSHEIPT